ncbi:hypothetical protein WJX72_009819 [[Myrmecia] bisecta]|uniref:U-box domain-containing protein n=1 Tax=[Myrmecia] bisecta TaxID=41462 RepID=A0AAW1QSC0_9CHLO
MAFNEGQALSAMFTNGLAQIQTSRSENLFQELDRRSLTPAEEEIVAQRVALQRKMLEEYEKRDRKRKVQEVMEICVDLTVEEAEAALKQFGWREEDTAAALTSDSNFRRKLRSMCGLAGAQQAQHAQQTVLVCASASGSNPQGAVVRPRKAVIPQPSKHQTSGAVFVGTFKGKGWERYAAKPKDSGSEDENAARRGNILPALRAVPDPAAQAISEPPPKAGKKGRRSMRRSARSPRRTLAVPVHKPRLGRVKRCSSKQVDLVMLGTLRSEPGWHNKGYIFPEGYVARTVFRSSEVLDQLCVHECQILGPQGSFWPAATFRIIAMDNPDAPLDAKSATGAWNAVLNRINDVIETRRRGGEDLPPPPRTAIAGPEYFGLSHPVIVAQIEALDPNHQCIEYWAGKEDRLAYGLVHGIETVPKEPRAERPPAASRPPRPERGASGLPSRRGRKRQADEDTMYADDFNGEEDEQYVANRWSGVDRRERYRRRCGADDSDAGRADDDNPLPDHIDPITLEPVVTPAISPYGHVMGLATWNAVLAEQGKCPFTQNPLRREQITVLTKNNIERYRDRIN